ncbi:MAG: acyltransferase [Pseudomonadota bacterium]
MHTPLKSRSTPDVIAERRHDLDWLRVIAFGLLIVFHAAVAFVPGGIPMVINEESSPLFGPFVSFLSQFRLGLLFFVSGLGTYFALKSRDRSAFFGDRARRLLIPLVVGIFVIVPPMVFLEKRYIGAFDGSLMEFYLAIPASGIYPDGHLSWHHYWFVAYLFLHCVMAWPIFERLLYRPESRLHRWSAYLHQPYGIYWLILPLLLIELPLRPAFPGFRNLYADWASFFHWGLIFVVGFVFAQTPALLERAKDLRLMSLCIGTICSGLLFSFFWAPGDGFHPGAGEQEITVLSYVVFSFIRIANAWCWTMACLGFACRYLNVHSHALTFLNRAVYPMFCVHLTALVGLEFVVFPLDWPVAFKFLAICLGCLLICLVANEIAQRNKYVGAALGVVTPAKADR